MRVQVAAGASQISAGPPPERPCHVVEVAALGGDVMRLVLDIIPDPEEGIGPLFEPGQFIELQIPGTDVWRAYSLANAPDWDGRLEFLIRLQPKGRFSTWLQQDAAAGQTLLSRGPQGAFGLRPGSLNRRIMVAGGTGLAPMLSILRQAVAFGEDLPTDLLFGVNRQQDLFATDLLQELTAALPSLKVTICLWQGGEGEGVFHGTPAQCLAALLADQDAAGCDLYICGPAALIDATEAVAEAAGFPAAQRVAVRFL
jgi:methane monooxygenase component C